MGVQAYPLHWPPGFPRTKWRENSRFKTGFDNALRNVQDSLRKFAADSGKKRRRTASIGATSFGSKASRAATPSREIIVAWHAKGIPTPAALRSRWPN